MTATEIQKLITSFENKPALTETHISYVLLTSDFAYKIKKPVRLPFLDFSSLEARKYYCEEELRLNKRLAEKMYLGIVPVSVHRGDIILSEAGELIDYAVKMKRMDTAREMDKMLSKQMVGEKHVVNLARKIAKFHASTPPVKKEQQLSSLMAVFNEIEEQQDIIRAYTAPAYAQAVSRAMHLSDLFLRSRIHFIQERSRRGLVRDIHGDLHSKNIFLCDDPVIFDCIEFSPDFRQIDLLNEVAFFCMDLEARHAPELSQQFYHHYLKFISQQGVKQVKDQALFVYFKLYRANVRAKVMAISAQEDLHSEKFSHQKQEMIAYLELLQHYSRQLQRLL